MDEGNALVKLFIQVPEKMREKEFDSLSCRNDDRNCRQEFI